MVREGRGKTTVHGTAVAGFEGAGAYARPVTDHGIALPAGRSRTRWAPLLVTNNRLALSGSYHADRGGAAGAVAVAAEAVVSGTDDLPAGS